ncbi:cytochrome c oxidase subunit 4 [Nocardioides sp. CFH 31398]|uniref:cytochrome c oxidase subunit 4 n=1 Tax=Nocardioides sp. CFH 31398 TaxID=2919579 RepID=UPI001F055788|nr:cytochrome c oxidase subunit 4 [Nocardioides sp. CFH 31398]MCH1868200.1 cytochrome c oxidase subunit 4 [Nocardioides sp. CFH 31398]
MKAETWVFGSSAIFFAAVSPVYWFVTGDWTGTSALVMATLLVLMVALYLGASGARMDPRPEDRKDGEIAEGAGELGFFPPYSWWPLWCASTLAVCVLGVVFGWWLFIIGVVFGSIALSGWVFEYYRGVHAH